MRAAGAGVEGVGIGEVFPIQVDVTKYGVVEGLFVEVGVLGVVVGEVHLVLEEKLAAAGAGFAIGVVAERIIRTEPFGGFAAADAAGDVIFFVDDVVPEGLDGGLVVEVAGFHGDVGHGGV